MYIKLLRDGINQNWWGINIRIKKILIQLRDKFLDVEGSKIKKRFIIIISFIW